MVVVGCAPQSPVSRFVDGFLLFSIKCNGANTMHIYRRSAILLTEFLCLFALEIGVMTIYLNFGFFALALSHIEFSMCQTLVFLSMPIVIYSE